MEGGAVNVIISVTAAANVDMSVLTASCGHPSELTANLFGLLLPFPTINQANLFDWEMGT